MSGEGGVGRATQQQLADSAKETEACCRATAAWGGRRRGVLLGDRRQGLVGLSEKGGEMRRWECPARHLGMPAPATAQIQARSELSHARFAVHSVPGQLASPRTMHGAPSARQPGPAQDAAACSWRAWCPRVTILTTQEIHLHLASGQFPPPHPCLPSQNSVSDCRSQAAGSLPAAGTATQVEICLLISQRASTLWS